MPCRKHVSRSGEVRGKQANRRTTMTTATGIVFERGTWPAILVTVKTGCAKYRRAFTDFCKHHNLVVRKVEESEPDDAYRTVFEITGGKALERLACTYPPAFVVSWCYPLNVGAPRIGMHGKALERGYTVMSA